MLGDAEVTSTSYVCAEPARVLVLRNANGMLDAVEVEQTQYVCDSGGVLVRTSAGAATRCPGSATVVSAGADADGDGVLSGGEIRTTALVCSPVVFSYTVTTQEDLDWLRWNVDLVQGSLSLRNSALADVSLSGVTVAGDVLVEDNPGLVSLGIRPLALGGNVVVARNPELESLVLSVGLSSDLPLPASVTVSDAPSLRFLAISTPAIGGSLTLARTGLTSFSLPDLERVGGSFVIDDNDALTSCSAPRVAYIGGDLVLQNDDAMTSPFDWLTFIGRPDPATHEGDLTVVGAIVVRQNARLQNLQYVPAVTAGAVRIESNPSLGGFDFFDLVAITGDWTISDNPKLANFGAASDPLRVVSGSIVVTGNASLAATAGLFPVQTVGGDVTISGSPLLRYFWMPYLVTVEDLRLEDTDVRTLGPDGGAGDTLVRLEVARSVALVRNANLARLDLPRLRSLSALTVQDAPLLPTCGVQALATRAGAAVTISGTDDAATCP